MKNAMQRLKKHNKKGFTLVELLVVLVILAILAAAIIPSMMGFIDRAKKESVAAEQRSVILAAQIQVNEMYGKGILEKLGTGGSLEIKDTGSSSSNPTIEYLEAIRTTADLPGTIESVTVTKNTQGTDENKLHWTITKAVYLDKDGKMRYTYEATEGTDGKYTAVWKDGVKAD